MIAALGRILQDVGSIIGNAWSTIKTGTGKVWNAFLDYGYVWGRCTFNILAGLLALWWLHSTDDSATDLAISIGFGSFLAGLNLVILVTYVVNLLNPPKLRNGAPLPNRTNIIRFLAEPPSSIWLALTAYAVLYSRLGIGPADKIVSDWDYLYFSGVTFSTLGYGDFQPQNWSKIPAMVEAIVGNLHLGLIVGSAYHLAKGNGQ